ncbi:Acyltransferase [Colletotrichum trifolii]|uniref:Acyltransferase n=1 Tax=Colletotrichum trifolii TaxID=5466 RepID=A0A4R8QJL8_COLTR|nr:Acyltransferase [Colletotrichum trifolii]
MAMEETLDAATRYRTTRKILPKTTAVEPTISKLSIIDATTARFTFTGAVWFYDKSNHTQPSYSDLFDVLSTTLSETLDDYPHFAGQLQWATPELVQHDAVPRHLGRPVVHHGSPDDPGVEFVLADNGHKLQHVVPSREDRATTLKEWDATNLDQDQFLPKTKLSLSSLRAVEKGLPSMAVQLTAFGCGGFSIGALISHPLADAVCLVNFMHSWAARSRCHLDPSSAASPPIPKPLFDPSLLDRVAGLKPDSPPDPIIVARARSLPMHRFDWWAEDAPGYLPAFKPSSLATMPPPDELAKTQLSPSTFPPWPTWDMSAPVDHVQIRFSSAELGRMKKAAQESLPDEMAGLHVSRLDAALAHIWTLITRARRHSNPGEQVYLNITLGLRARVDPPLPEAFVGSPLLLCYVEKSAEESATACLGPIAGAIRETMSRFTPDAVAAYVHDAAHEVSPQRLWQAFLGTRHTGVTSWVRARTYELDFLGAGELARYVHAIMPLIDGLVHVNDVADTGDLIVGVCVQREVMGRLLADPLLREYEVAT